MEAGDMSTLEVASLKELVALCSSLGRNFDTVLELDYRNGIKFRGVEFKRMAGNRPDFPANEIRFIGVPYIDNTLGGITALSFFSHDSALIIGGAFGSNFFAVLEDQNGASIDSYFEDGAKDFYKKAFLQLVIGGSDKILLGYPELFRHMNDPESKELIKYKEEVLDYMT